MSKQLGFVIDVNRCLGCGACIKACTVNNRLPLSLSWRQLRPIEEFSPDQAIKFNLSTACNHCNNPECLRICPSGAYAKRRDGIVLHNPEKCIACKSCVASCPFGAPQINPQTQKAGKCQLCYQRLDQGDSPYCVDACLTGALRLTEIKTLPSSELLRLTAPLPSLRLTRPATFYTPPRPTELG